MTSPNAAKASAVKGCGVNDRACISAPGLAEYPKAAHPAIGKNIEPQTVDGADIVERPSFKKMLAVHLELGWR